MLGIVPKSTLEGIKPIICCQECVRLMCTRFFSDFSQNGRFEIGLFSLFSGGMNRDKRGMRGNSFFEEAVGGKSQGSSRRSQIFFI